MGFYRFILLKNVGFLWFGFLGMPNITKEDGRVDFPYLKEILKRNTHLSTYGVLTRIGKYRSK
jgi:hypothetical protein